MLSTSVQTGDGGVSLASRDLTPGPASLSWRLGLTLGPHWLRGLGDAGSIQALLYAAGASGALGLLTDAVPAGT